MDLCLFRLSLKPRPIVSLCEPLKDGAPLNRVQWLRLFFGATREFKHRNNDFAFVPETGISERELIFGWIARRTTLLERTPPSEGLEHPPGALNESLHIYGWQTLETFAKNV